MTDSSDPVPSPADDPQQMVLELMEGIDAGAILLRPFFNDRGVIIDAEIEWANTRSTSMWFNTDGLAPGTRVCEVYFDAADWLAAANLAWQGTTSRRWIEGSPSATPWTRALEIIRRVGDRLAELTVDRSTDQEFIDALKELEQRHRSILSDLPVTVITSFAGRGRIEYINPQAEVLTGVPLAELEKVARWGSLIHPDDLARVESVRHAVLNNDKWSGAVRLVRPDGELRHVEVNVRGRQDSDHAERQFVLTLLDVTDRVEAQARAQQAENLASLARTSGAFAHEFNNLLQVISGNIDLAGNAADPAAHLANAQAAVGRAAQLVSGLLAFASGRPGVARTVSIPAMYGRVADGLRAGLPESVRLDVTLADDLPLAMIDESALHQIMVQVVTNAAEAMPEGGTLRVTVDETSTASCHLPHAPASGRWLRIAVTDTGRGIPPEQLSLVWEPFHSTKRGAGARGAGLGLSTVHGLVHQFDGHVTIASAEGGGTTVSLLVPAADPDVR